MSTRQLPQPRAQWWASDGTPLSGGKIYTYEPGTTTNKPTWRDAQKSVANANPVILDSRGEAVIYWDGEYKVRVTDASDTLIYEQDNYGSGEVPIHSDGASLNPNPGFERDTDGDGRPDGWTITEYEPNTIVRDTTAANVESGSAALKFTTSDGGVSGVAISELVPVSPDEFIYLTARAKTSNTALKQYVSIQWFNATRNTLGSTHAPKSDLLTSYSDITLSAQSPYSAARYAAIRIDGPNWDGTELGSTWFDECRLERAAQVNTDYFVNPKYLLWDADRDNGGSTRSFVNLTPANFPDGSKDGWYAVDLVTKDTNDEFTVAQPRIFVFFVDNGVGSRGGGASATNQSVYMNFMGATITRSLESTWQVECTVWTLNGGLASEIKSIYKL